MKYLLPLIILFASTFALAQEATVTSQTANLRGIPGIKGKQVTSLANGTDLQVIEEENGWYLVQTPEYVGWISGKLIKLASPFQDKGISLFEKARVFGGNVTLRGTASDDGQKIAVLPNGTALDIYQKNGDWYLIQSSGYAGWIRGDSMREISPQSTSESITRTGNTIFRNEDLGGEFDPRVSIQNNADRTLNLTFGGVTYIIKPGKSRSIAVKEGKYRYTAAGGGATPYTRVDYFEKGRVYVAVFQIVTRKR